MRRTLALVVVSLCLGALMSAQQPTAPQPAGKPAPAAGVASPVV
jgi:hypothetical protein